jgi:putative PIN family toxin of toxin-antitoxin system
VRVVFDTNIFISAFAIPGGNAEEAYLHAVRGRFDLFTSFFILTETANILRTKFDWSDEKVEQLLTSISKTATVLKPQPHLHILRDEPDNRILECALLAEANIIVSGDHHLLSLVCHEEIRMLTLADFLERLSHS